MNLLRITSGYTLLCRKIYPGWKTKSPLSKDASLKETSATTKEVKSTLGASWIHRPDLHILFSNAGTLTGTPTKGHIATK